jgi:pimeloyl-ACP methyl ester carboxylesterase
MPANSSTTKRRLQYDVVTSHGMISVEESFSPGPVILFIHGNSSCRGVFRKQFDSPLAERHRLICFDLPGHGDSSDSRNPSLTYSRPGLAAVTVELLERLNIDKVVVAGWSLGGHVAIEALNACDAIAGLFLSGSPPVGTNMAEGFRHSPLNGLASREDLSPREVSEFVDAIFGSVEEPLVYDAVQRTDRKFRPTLFQGAREGKGCNQRDVIEKTEVPTAIVNGADD